MKITTLLLFFRTVIRDCYSNLFTQVRGRTATVPSSGLTSQQLGGPIKKFIGLIAKHLGEKLLGLYTKVVFLEGVKKLEQ